MCGAVVADLLRRCCVRCDAERCVPAVTAEVSRAAAQPDTDRLLPRLPFSL